LGFEVIEKELKKRLRHGSYPPFWSPKEKGETLVGQVTAVRPSVWDEKVNTYEVKTFNGEFYSTPNNAVLNRLFEEFKIKVGDYIMIQYEGIVTTGRGRKAKDFSVAVLPKDEAERILRAEKEKVKPLVLEEKAMEEKPAPPKTGEGKVPAEVRDFIEELFSFYTHGIPEDQFRKYLERRDIKVPMDKLLKECGLTVIDGIVRRE